MSRGSHEDGQHGPHQNFFQINFFHFVVSFLPTAYTSPSLPQTCESIRRSIILNGGSSSRGNSKGGSSTDGSNKALGSNSRRDTARPRSLLMR